MTSPNPSPIEKVLLVWDRIGDYHAARFRALEKLYPDVEFHIADLGGADTLYGWQNPLAGHPRYHNLSSYAVEQADLKKRFLAFRNIVKNQKIQVVGIAGYGRMEYRLMLIWCRFHHVRTILFAESWYGENRWVNRLKGSFLRWTCAAFLVSGQRALSHFRDKLGLRSKPFAIGYSVVDNDHFSPENGVEREKILLCVARFSPEKNLEILMEAFQQSNLSKDWTLKIVGGGPLKNQLVQKITNTEKVQLLDWLSYSALPYLYQQASFFILPSTFEPWGLVVNEAMAAGLPVAVSTACGCLPELVDVRNGFSFRPTNLDELKFILNQIGDLSPLELELMGKRSREIIRQFRPDDWARRFMALAENKALD